MAPADTGAPMTSRNDIPRYLALAAALGGVAACTGSGRTPPEPIGYVAGPPRPPRHELVLEGRVDDPPVLDAAMDQAPDAYGYASDGGTMVSRGQETGLMAPPPAGGAVEMPEGGSDAGTAMQATIIPEGGVNMDAALGVAPAPAPANGRRLPLKGNGDPAAEPAPLPPGSRLTIAEDNPEQPVVDGIGTDDPVMLVR